MEFEWVCHKEAGDLVLRLLEESARLNRDLNVLQQQLIKYTSTTLIDFTDHFIIGNDEALFSEIRSCGFEEEGNTLYHRGAQLPHFILQKDSKEGLIGLSIHVEHIADYLAVRGLSIEIEGEIFSSSRRCLISKENNFSFFVIEKRGFRPIDPGLDYCIALEKWKTRPRSLDNEEASLTFAINLAHELAGAFGKDMAACIVLECERFYWQNRNTAAAFQKSRQDRLGMGWANHDHHTFRSSRHFFHKLVDLFKILGFHCRERFYAGDEAGWGAQVLENPRAGFVLFLDVDLSPDEIKIDFAHTELPPLPKLNTVGLWCALHGDSILKGGMHHLEAQFSFKKLREDLKEMGVSMMDPFSNFSYLKQAFTKGEVWPVDKKRIEKLLNAGLITKEQAHRFENEGALGSHLENLERNEGYKGFNKHNVSVIIQKTDPRLSFP